MPNTQDYNNLTEQQKKAIDEAMAASNPQKTSKLKDETLHQIKEAYKGPLLNIIKAIDKSAYVEVLDNNKTSEYILKFIEVNGTMRRLAYEDQINHYEKMVEDHMNQSAQRREIIKRSETQGMAALTEEERKIMVSNTQLETLLQGATKSFFETQRANCLEQFDRDMRNYAQTVKNNPDAANIETFKRSFEYTRNDFGATKLWDEATGTFQRVELYKFRDGDVPKYLYDDAEYDKVLKNYDTYLRTHIKEIEKDFKLREYGRDMERKAENLMTFGRQEESWGITMKQYVALRDKTEKIYLEAKKKYDTYEKQLLKDPNYKSHLNSSEYARVLNDQYYNGKYDGKIFENLPDVEKAIYVLNKYPDADLRRVPLNEREWFNKGLSMLAVQQAKELESGIDKVEQDLEKFYWNDPRNARDKNFQMRELEENRAILSAYNSYLSDNSDKNLKKFYEEVNKAYENAKQQYIDNPDLRERFEVRAEQIQRGDFTFVPMINHMEAKRLGMTAHWDQYTHTNEEFRAINREEPKKTVFQKQFEKAYSQHISPIAKQTIETEIYKSINNREDLTLKQMGASLKGKDLEDYKATIRDEKMEQFKDNTASGFKKQIDNIKQEKAALRKHYGFISRFFNANYKAKVHLLEHHEDLIRKNYQNKLNETKYDILKTYQEKGLALTKEETRELNNLTKNGTVTGKIMEWDGARAREKHKLDEINSKWNPQKEQPKAPVKTQLDLSEKIHTAKAKEQPVKEDVQIQKTKEIEEKVKEETDLEK